MCAVSDFALFIPCFDVECYVVISDGNDSSMYGNGHADACRSGMNEADAQADGCIVIWEVRIDSFDGSIECPVNQTRGRKKSLEIVFVVISAVGLLNNSAGNSILANG